MECPTQTLRSRTPRAQPAIRPRSTALTPWSGRDLATLVEGLKGAIVATHSQSGSVGHHMVRYLKEDDAAGKCGAPGACLAMLKGLITIDGVCSFANPGSRQQTSPYPLPGLQGLVSVGHQQRVRRHRCGDQGRRRNGGLHQAGRPFLWNAVSGRHSHDDDEHEESRGLRRDPEMGGQEHSRIRQPGVVCEDGDD